jgi:xylan 1,4-beta-xylosidase
MHRLLRLSIASFCLFSNSVTGTKGTPIDLISFHAKGQPKFVDGHVRMGISNQLRDIDSAFAAIAKFPTLKDKPIVIGESDPEGCAACQGPQNGYRNGTMYSSSTAPGYQRPWHRAG